MTDTECKDLNESIALKRDWEHESSKEPLRRWKDPSTGFWHKHPPNFTHKWEHAGPLWDEMNKVLGYHDSTDRIESEYNNNWSELTEAIALAYDAWKEEKQ